LSNNLENTFFFTSKYNVILYRAFYLWLCSLVRGLGRWVVLAGGGTHLADLGAALVGHLGLSHVGLAAGAAHHGGGAGAGEAPLHLVSLEILLVLKLSLHVLVPLKELVVLDLTLLESLVHPGLDFFAESIHLIGLFLNECGLGSDNLLVAGLHVAVSLLVLHLDRLDLDLVSLRILLLSCELALDGLQVEELSRQLEGEGELLLEHLAVLLEVTDVALFKGPDGLLVLLLNLSEGIVPPLVEVLVLHQVGLLNLFSLAGLIIN